MLAAYIFALRDSFNRRMALVLTGLSVVLAIVFIWIVKVKFLRGPVVFLGPRMFWAADRGVPSVLTIVMEFTSGVLWILLAILAAAPVLSSTLEKGWVELTLSKGTSRWQILLGSYFAGVTMYFTAVVVAITPIAFYLWWQTKVSSWPLSVSILLQTLSFAALLAIAAFATLPRLGAVLPILFAMAVYIVSAILAQRERMLYQFLTSRWSHVILDGLYRILPKTSELSGTAARYIQGEGITSWWPLWSTGIFIVGTLSLTAWLLHRKSL
jgi:ABC-type transport system involved in multi-copper enzyme maturation permease subunit